MKANSSRFLALMLSVSMTVGPAVSVAGAETDPMQILGTAETAENPETQEPEVSVIPENTEVPVAEAGSPEAEAPAAETPAVETPEAEAPAADTPAAGDTSAPQETQQTENGKEETKPFTIAKVDYRTEEGKSIAVISTADDTYDRIYVGSLSDAEKTPVIRGEKNGSGGYDFKIPLKEEQFGRKLTFIFGSEKDNTWKDQKDLGIDVPAGETFAGQEAGKEEVPAAAEEKKEEGTTVADAGLSAVYGSDDAKKPGQEYKMFQIAESQARVVNGQMELTIWVKPSAGGTFTYDAIYIGNKSDENKDTIVPGEEDTAKNLEKFTFLVPLSAQGSEIHFVPRSRKTQKFSTSSSLAIKVPDLGLTETPSNPLEGKEVNDGITAGYGSDDAKKPGQAYSMFQIAKSSAKVHGDQMDVTIWVKPSASGKFTYDAIYIGNKSDETKEPVVMGETDSEQNLQKYTFTVPLSSQGQEVHFVPRSAKTQKFSTSSSLVFHLPKFETGGDSPIVTPEPDPQPSVDPKPTDEPSELPQEVTGNAGVEVRKTEDNTAFKMFIIKHSEVTKKDGKLEIAITTDNTSYDKIYLGKSEDAVKEPVIQGKKKLNGGWTFTFTVDENLQGTEVPVVLGKPDGTWYSNKELKLYIPEIKSEDKQEEHRYYRLNAVTDAPADVLSIDPANSYVRIDFDYLMQTVIGVKSNTYTRMYLGTAEELQDISKASYISLYEKDGSYAFAKGGYVSDLGKKINFMLYDTRTGKWSPRSYTLEFPTKETLTEIPKDEERLSGVNTSQDPYAENVKPPVISTEPEQPEAVDQISVRQGGTGVAYNSFKVVSSTAKKNGSQIDMTIKVNGNSFTRLYIGSQADDDKTPEIKGVYDEASKTTSFTFSVPEEKQGMNIAVTPGAASWMRYARELFLTVPVFDKKAETADGVYDLYGSAYTNNVGVERNSQVVVKGDQATVTIITNARSYDKIYIGNVGDEESVKNAKAIERQAVTDPSDYYSFTFTVPASAIGSTVPFVVHNASSDTWFTRQDQLTINGFLPKTGEGKEDPGETPEEPKTKVPEDGTYSTKAETGAAMFKVVDVELTVKDQKMTALVTLSGTGYDYLYMGSKADAEKADKSSLISVKGSKKYIDEKTSEEKEGYQYEIPVSALDTPLTVASHSARQDKWYDRTITISSSELKKNEDTPAQPGNLPADGKYSTTAQTNAQMFKVVDVELTVKDQKMTARITLSGNGYNQLYLGSKEDAAKADPASLYPVAGTKTYTDPETGAEKTGDCFEIPVSVLDAPIAVASHATRSGKWFDRTITISSADLKKTGDVATDDPKDPSEKPSEKPEDKPAPKPGTSKEDDKKPEKESTYKSDLSGSTSKVNSSTALKDGVYKPDGFSWSGGSGRINITCSKVTITNGQAYATISFSSPYYTYVKANGNQYNSSVGGGMSTVTIPIALNQNNKIIGMTTRMTVPHEITYTIFVSLKAAGGDAASGAKSISNRNKLDEEAPEIMGLEFKEEAKLDHAEYFKMYEYDKGVMLVEIDLTKDTARKAEVRDPEEEKTTDDSAEETAEQNGTAEAKTANDISAELYQGNIIKYLIVPERVEIPAGLDKDVVIVQLPADKTYVASAAVLNILAEDLKVEDNITAVGVEEKDISSDKVKKALEDGTMVSAGTYEEPDYKELVKGENNLAILPAEILPKKENQELTVEEQTERMNELTEKFAVLRVPAVIDRSVDEKTELGKAEWIKVYGVLFNCREQADKIYQAAVKKAKK